MIYQTQTRGAAGWERTGHGHTKHAMVETNGIRMHVAQAGEDMDQLIPNLNLRRTTMLPGCGHWTQQERADGVNAARIGFLKDLS